MIIAVGVAAGFRGEEAVSAMEDDVGEEGRRGGKGAVPGCVAQVQGRKGGEVGEDLAAVGRRGDLVPVCKIVTVDVCEGEY